MVSPQTHLEKNHEYQSRTTESQFKIMSLWVFMLPRSYLKTDSKTLYTPSIVNTTRLKEICVVKQQPEEQPQKSHEQDIHQKQFQFSHKLNASLGIFMHQESRMQDAEVTESLPSKCLIYVFCFSYFLFVRKS